LPLLLLCSVAVIGAGILVYSQIWAFTWDESYHLLAAQLINHGKRPYLDFCFPQTPLDVYWNAAWMRLFGETWRVPHAVSAVLVMATIWLAIGYVRERLPLGGWRLSCAMVVLAAIGLNCVILEYGVTGQAYGLCLLLTFAAFRLAVLAVSRTSGWPAAAAGFTASAAAASTLLTAVAAPVVLLWILVYNQTGSRSKKVAAYLMGAFIPLLPVLWLFTKSPRVVMFNVFEYHLHFRKLYWPESTQHNVEVLTSWIDNGPALLLGLLAITGILFVAFQSGWDRPLRSELYLCGWLATAIGAELSMPRPTFARYFLLTVPFLAVLACVGFYCVGSRLVGSERSLWLVFALISLFAFGLAKSLHERHSDLYAWRDYEAMARKVNQVTPPNGTLFADEPIYFLTKRMPPSGLELYYTHLIKLPAPLSASLHLLPEEEMYQQVKSGMYDTAFSCEDDVIEKLGLPRLYANREEIDGCNVFWGKRTK